MPSMTPRIKVADLGTLYCGQSPPSGTVNIKGEGVPYMTGPEQWDGHKIVINKWTTDPRRMVPDGCIFITVKGAGVGKIFPGHAGAIGRDIYAFEPVKELSPRFVEHSLRQTVQEILKGAVGDIPGISKRHILEHEISVPPRDIQDGIVAEIEKQFSRLDEAVASLKRAQANLRRYKAAVLKAAVEGKLTEQWRKDHPDVEPASELLKRILAERRAKWEEAELAKMKAKGKTPKDDQWKAKYKEPATPDTTKLPELPDGWVWANVDQLAEVGTGATPKRGRSRYYDGDIPWVTSAVVNSALVDQATEFVTKEALAENNLTIYPPGTLLVAMYGEGKTRGKCSELRISAATNQALAALQCDERVRTLLRLFLDCNYEETRKVAAGGVQPNLNLSVIRALRVPFPPPTEQRWIVAEANQRLSLLCKTGYQVDANLQRAQRLRHSIVANAFSGAFEASAGNEIKVAQGQR